MPAETSRQPLSAAQQQTMAAIVAAVPEALRQIYGGRLLAVVLFGSVARGTPHPHSDSDWLVVLRQRSNQPRDDHRGVEQLRQKLAPLLRAAAQG